MKMNGYAGLLLVVLGLLTGTVVRGQHQPQIAQYMFNGLLLNPAFAGRQGMLHTSFLYRNQWLGMPGASQTETFLMHTTSKDRKNNYGVTFIADQTGGVNRNSLTGIYAYRLELGKSTLAFGVQGGLTMARARLSQLARTDDGDPLIPDNSPAVFIPQTGTGVYFTHPSFYAVFSVPELLRYRSPVYDQFWGIGNSYRHYYFTAGGLIPVGRDLKIKPSVLVRYMRTVPLQIDLNTNFIIKDMIWLGISYRNQDMVGLVEYQLNEQLRLGYAFETSLSPLRTHHRGTHEFMLSYQFRYKVRAPDLLYF